MPVCAAAVAALATFYQDPDDTPKAARDTVVRLIAKMPTIAAASFKHSIGQPFVYPQNRLDYSANFLHMMFATRPARPGGPPGARTSSCGCVPRPRRRTCQSSFR